MLCIAKMLRAGLSVLPPCRTLSPAAVQLRKLVAAGEIPDTAYACIAVIHSFRIGKNPEKIAKTI